MRLILLAALALSCTSLCVSAQTTPAAAKTPAVSIYVQGQSLDYAHLVPDPPAADSKAAKTELAFLHRLQRTRTAAQVKAAQTDDVNENMFLYATLLGPGFNPEALPLTAAFSAHLRKESSVINPMLKVRFARPRPYVTDKTLHLVCEPSQANAYPSGHAMVGYLEGLALTQMVPEHADAILLRAKDYANNRMVCGAHYPSDIEASHTIALALFGNLSSSPQFQKELATARAELRHALNLPM